MAGVVVDGALVVVVVADGALVVGVVADGALVVGVVADGALVVVVVLVATQALYAALSFAKMRHTPPTKRHSVPGGGTLLASVSAFFSGCV